MRRIYLTLIVFLACLSSFAQDQAPAQRQRLFVLTDIGNEPDDMQSMTRLLLYSNSIDIEGLAASTSTHMKHDVNPGMLHKLITAYGKVRSNLMLHQTNWPTEDYLHGIVKAGLPLYGMEAVGEGKDSEASEYLIECIQREDARPLWVTAWGGVNILGQALYKLKATKSKKELDKLVAKIRVYTISDQDDAGCWLRTNFPKLFYVCSPVGYGQSTWMGFNSAEVDNTTISYDWLLKNIRQGHGPLGACYPEVSYAMEGDTPSFLGLIPNGLSNMEHPDWGGWGGRYEMGTPNVPLDQIHDGVEHTPETRPLWTDTKDTYKPYDNRKSFFAQMRDTTKYVSQFATIFRWREATQNDFAARMRWCHTTYKEANHAPVVKVNMDGKEIITEEVTVKGGTNVNLDATICTDPDDDALNMYWYQYWEPGTCKESILGFHAPNEQYLHDVEIPKVTKPATIHLILQVTDNGTPAMTSYKRIIFNIKP